MVDYMIFDVVREAISNALAYGKEHDFGDGAIAAEVKNLPKADSVAKVHSFIFCEVITTDGFNHHDKEEFLRGQVHSAHERHLHGESIISKGWGPAVITLGFKKLVFPAEPSDYSIVIGAMGDHSAINQQILDEVLKDLSQLNGA